MQDLLPRIHAMRERLTSIHNAPAPAYLILDLLQDIATAIEASTSEAVAGACRTLSYSERTAIIALIDAMPDETGGVVVTSRIADKNGVTRSTVVNTLRRFEGAGVLRTNSLGASGTHIQLLGGPDQGEHRSVDPPAHRGMR